MFKKRRTEGDRVTLLPKQPSFSTTKQKTNNENDFNIEFNSEYYRYQGLAYRRGACSWAKRKNITFISKWITFPNRITKAKKSHCLHSHAIKLKQKALTHTHIQFFENPQKGELHNSTAQRVIPHHRIYKISAYETTAHGRLQRMKNHLRNLPYSRLSDDIEDNFKCIQYTKRPGNISLLSDMLFNIFTCENRNTCTFSLGKERLSSK